MSSLANSFAWQLRKNCVLSLGQIDVHDRAGEQVFHGVFFAELELNLLPAAVNNGALTSCYATQRATSLEAGGKDGNGIEATGWRSTISA